MALKYLGITEKELEDLPGNKEFCPEITMDFMLMFKFSETDGNVFLRVCVIIIRQTVQYLTQQKHVQECPGSYAAFTCVYFCQYVARICTLTSGFVKFQAESTISLILLIVCWEFLCLSFHRWNIFFNFLFVCVQVFVYECKSDRKKQEIKKEK